MVALAVIYYSLRLSLKLLMSVSKATQAGSVALASVA